MLILEIMLCCRPHLSKAGMHWYISSLIFAKETVILMQMNRTTLWLDRGYGLIKLLHNYNMHNSQRICCANSNMFDHGYIMYIWWVTLWKGRSFHTFSCLLWQHLVFKHIRQDLPHTESCYIVSKHWFLWLIACFWFNALPSTTVFQHSYTMQGSLAHKAW